MTQLSISKAWEETREVIARDGGLLTTIALALFVLPGVISGLATPLAAQGQLPAPGGWTILSAIALVIALVGQLAVIRLAIGSRQTVGEAIGHGARRAPAYLAATLMWVAPFAIAAVVLVGLVVGKPPSPAAALALVAIALAGMFLAIRMLMSSPVASAEAVGPIAILRRSWALTSGHWLRLFGFFLLFLVGAVIAIIAISSVAGLIGQLAFGNIRGLTLGGLFVGLITQIASAAASVILMVMLARIYVQLAGDGGAAR